MPYRAHRDEPNAIPADRQAGKCCRGCRRLFIIHALGDQLHRWLFCPYCGLRRPNPGYAGRKKLRELGWKA